MLIDLVRTQPLADRTFGRYSITYEGEDASRPFCDAIEDTDPGLTSDMSEAEIAATKVRGKTAIPTGIYWLRVARSPKRGRDVVWVLDVPGFRAIQLHAGDDPDDTDGCPLLGRLVGDQLDGGPALEAWLVKAVRRAAQDGEPCRLRVSREYGGDT